MLINSNNLYVLNINLKSFKFFSEICQKKNVTSVLFYLRFYCVFNYKVRSWMLDKMYFFKLYFPFHRRQSHPHAKHLPSPSSPNVLIIANSTSFSGHHPVTSDSLRPVKIWICQYDIDANEHTGKYFFQKYLGLATEVLALHDH